MLPGVFEHNPFKGAVNGSLWSMPSELRMYAILALIWVAHIGMDRLMGYGLKYPSAFKDTHLQHV